MILPGIPADGITDWAFYSPQQDTTTTRGFKTWVKPAGCSWVYIFVQGAGGGGGAGFTAAAGAARGGGGGGGSGGSQRLFIPAWSIPDVLYLRPGSGGLAVAAGTQTFVAITPSNSTANLLVSLAGGSAGGTGTGAAAGAAGSAGAATAIQQLAFAALALSFGGNAGALGGAQTGAVGASVTPGAATTSATTGGAGGGGTPIANTDFAGGTIVAAGAWPAIAGGTAAGGVGRAGFAHQLRITQYLARNIPPITSGGTGGGTNGAAGTGGAGGPAGWGSGGGGGGGGVTGGAGGAGGDGYIVIGAF